MSWRTVFAASAALGALGLAYDELMERSRLVHDHLVVPVERARPDSHLAILHVSDLHVDAWSPFRRWRLRRWAGMLRALPFDVLVFSGDLIDDELGVEPGAAFLGQVAAGRPAFAVLGNHDYHHYPWWENILNVHTMRDLGWVRAIEVDQDVPRIVASYARAGVETLTNRGRLVSVDGAEFWFAGVDDLIMGLPDLNRATDGAPENVPWILISHHPDLFPWAEMAGFDLTLSGHTHGGQIRLPGIGPLITGSSLDRGMVAGLTRNSRGALHVSRGLGETIPLRVRCPVQATVIEVRAGATCPR
jgi:uncharacterized protein